MKHILFIFGTRPEAIKLAPLILLLKQKSKFKISTCSSSQHVELLHQVLTFFNIKIDYNLNIMTHKQSLFDITTKCLSNFDTVLSKTNPDLIIVQGDTSTAFSGALAGFYKKIPVAHIEAGLRTNTPYNPFPEEMNRKLISQLATYHFAPTEKNKQDLNKEGITKNVWVVGNTVIDALDYTHKYVCNGYQPKINFNNTKYDTVILVTGHRRESVGKPFIALCKELKAISKNKQTQMKREEN